MWQRWSCVTLCGVLLAVAVLLAGAPAAAQTAGEVPGNSLGATSDTEFWRQVRRGEPGRVSIPNPGAGVMIQSEGDNWRAARNGPLSIWGAWALLGMIVLLALFFAIRGRIRIGAGPSGVTIERFTGVERFAHWLMALSFIVLALTGLNLLYGRYVLKPLIGAEAFAVVTELGKVSHNFVGFAFMVGLALAFVLWVVHNFPRMADLIWLLKGGGLLTRSHPPAHKFNAGQKILFWLVMLGGLSVSLSGIALTFPFEFSMFSETFAVANRLGADLPSNLTATEEMQLSQLWHAAMALFLTAVILAHIYIGTIGMEGAFDAMGSGRVDANWAKEHHSLWAEKAMHRARSVDAAD